MTFDDENQDGIISRAEKGKVRDFLKDFNDRSQEKARIELDAVQVDYTSYWIANAISVKNLNSKLLENLMKVAGHEIKSILPGMHGGIYRVKPTAVGNVMSKNELSGDPIQWNIKKVTADKMWEKGFNGSGVVVATLDGGVNYQHESLWMDTVAQLMVLLIMTTTGTIGHIRMQCPSIPMDMAQM